jgi:hypothetical protein
MVSEIFERWMARGPAKGFLCWSCHGHHADSSRDGILDDCSFTTRIRVLHFCNTVLDIYVVGNLRSSSGLAPCLVHFLFLDIRLRSSAGWSECSHQHHGCTSATKCAACNCTRSRERSHDPDSNERVCIALPTVVNRLYLSIWSIV